jgi:hypothetical protein
MIFVNFSNFFLFFSSRPLERGKGAGKEIFPNVGKLFIKFLVFGMTDNLQGEIDMLSFIYTLADTQWVAFSALKHGKLGKEGEVWNAC